MSMVTGHLMVRMGGALILAVLSIVGLSIAVEHLDAPSKSSAISLPSAARIPVSKADGDFGLHEKSPSRRRRFPSLPRYESLGFRLRPTPGTILLANRGASMAPDIAPVVEILANGELLLRRSLPVAVDPQDSPILSHDGHGAGVVLPVADLDALSPRARGALIWLIQEWLVERPVSPAKFAANGLQLNRLALHRLLSWVP